jgi:hypothetical protein
MDIYEQNYTQVHDIEQSLVRFHASDADEIQNAQIFYELASPLNETFSLHPLTGQLYLLNREYLHSYYEFDVYAYDRYRKRFVDNNMKTRTHVKLRFESGTFLNSTITRYQTMNNRTIECDEHVSFYNVTIHQRKHIDLLNIHQPILTIDIQPKPSNVQVFLLNQSFSSSNIGNLFLHNNNVYFNRYSMEEYQLEFLLYTFNQRWQCQPVSYRLLPDTDFNISAYYFPSIQPIELDDNLPVDTFITRIQLKSNDSQTTSCSINYKLLNDDKYLQFYLQTRTGILRLAERLQTGHYRLDIQANIHRFNRRYSIETTIDIHIRETNKNPPKFSHQTATELIQLPYQFQAVDIDQNHESNARVTYRLDHCLSLCPFELDPNNGTLTIRTENLSLVKQVFYMDIVAFDWGHPISLASRISVRVNLSLTERLIKRDLTRTRAYSRRWKKKLTQPLSSVLTSPLTTLVTQAR